MNAPASMHSIDRHSLTLIDLSMSKAGEFVRRCGCFVGKPPEFVGKPASFVGWRGWFVERCG
jgi:hypothetical protein